MRDQNNISLERVIRGLAYHSGGNCFKSDDDETGCPYWKDSFCSQHLCSDVLTLLKVQEPVEYVVHCKNADLSNGIEFACGECGGSLLHKKVNYCPWCGRVVKWE